MQVRSILNVWWTMLFKVLSLKDSLFSHTRSGFSCEIIRIYHEFEGEIENPSRGSPICITRLAE